MSIKDLIAKNLWHPRKELPEVGKLIQEVLNDPKWSWARNPDCKYVSIRIDMRNGGFVVMNRNDERIDPQQLKLQYRFSGNSNED